MGTGGPLRAPGSIRNRSDLARPPQLAEFSFGQLAHLGALEEDVEEVVHARTLALDFFLVEFDFFVADDFAPDLSFVHYLDVRDVDV